MRYSSANRLAMDRCNHLSRNLSVLLPIMYLPPRTSHTAGHSCVTPWMATSSLLLCEVHYRESRMVHNDSLLMSGKSHQPQLLLAFMPHTCCLPPIVSIRFSLRYPSSPSCASLVSARQITLLHVTIAGRRRHDRRQCQPPPATPLGVHADMLVPQTHRHWQAIIDSPHA